MSDKDPLNPARKDASKNSNPAAPNPGTRHTAASQAASTTSTSTSTSAAGGGASAESGSHDNQTGARGTTGGQNAGGQPYGGQQGATGQKDRMQEEMNQTGSKVKSEANSAFEELTASARKTAEAQAERQQEAAAGELGGLASALRKTADEVQGQTYFPLDQYARKAADKLEDLSESLRGGDIRSALGRLETYTREQPGVVLGGAIISGFLLARFMRASGEHPQNSHNSSQYGAATGRPDTTNPTMGGTSDPYGATAGGTSRTASASPSTGMYPGGRTPY